MSLAPRAVLVHRRTELEELLERHGTRGQVEFVLRGRGRSLGEVQAAHDHCHSAVDAAAAAVPRAWRTARVERADLPWFAFSPEDVVVVVGQDGLVANAAKYLAGQPVIGVDAGGGVGVLVPHRPAQVGGLLGAVQEGSAVVVARTMVRTELDDGQRLVALNEVYIGDAGHQSARYELAVPDGRRERQSSSGVVVGTGTGSSGWCASLRLPLRTAGPVPDADSPELTWFVREAWPSPATGTELTAGVLGRGEEVELVVRSDHLVVFGDGMEADRLTAGWGQALRVGVAAQALQHVVGGRALGGQVLGGQVLGAGRALSGT